MNAMRKTTSVALMSWVMAMGTAATALAGPLPKDDLNRMMTEAKGEMADLDRTIEAHKAALLKARQEYVEAMGMFDATGEREFFEASRTAVARIQRLASAIARAAAKKQELESHIAWLQAQLDQWAQMDAEASKPKPKGEAESHPANTARPRPASLTTNPDGQSPSLTQLPPAGKTLATP